MVFLASWVAVGIAQATIVVTASETPQLITAIAALITAIATLRAVRGVHKDVRTGNETSAGILAANAETRRIREIPHDERTEKEQRHVDEAPPDEPAQDPSPEPARGGLAFWRRRRP